MPTSDATLMASILSNGNVTTTTQLDALFNAQKTQAVTQQNFVLTGSQLSVSSQSGNDVATAATILGLVGTGAVSVDTDLQSVISALTSGALPQAVAWMLVLFSDVRKARGL